MANIYFGKISKNGNPDQFKDHYVKATEKWMNDIQIGDYAFVAFDGQIDLWRNISKNPIDGEFKWDFELIHSKIDINTKKFRNLKGLFINSSLVLIQRQSSIGFIKLNFENNFDSNKFLDVDYLKSSSSYRKISLIYDEKDIDSDSSNIQLLVNNNTIELIPASFIAQDTISEFKDRRNERNGSHKNKDKIFERLDNFIKNKRNDIDVDELSIADLYDSFFCEYKNRTEDEVEENTKEFEMTEKDYVQLLSETKNLILHGAPGTGKTFLAKQIAEAMGCSKDEIGFCQFHPSYDYTDFVEGLRPTKNNGFERKDGIFKSFCKKALQNVIDSNKSVTQIQIELSWQEKIKVFLDDAIENSIECPLKKNGCVIIESYHDDIIDISLPGNESHKEDTIHISKLLTILSTDQSFESAIEIERYLKGFHSAEYSYILALYRKIKEYSFDSKITVNTVSKIKPKNYIFIIDEINRGELSKIFGELFFSIDPGYRGEEGRVNTQYQNLIEDDFFKDGFYIPDNVYIIGTMNDIDRSVESMDFAMRRRFTFVEVTAEESAENMNITGDALAKMNAINKVISKMPELGKSYCIGAAYFKDATDLQKLWDLKISSLVYEYLRGIDNYTNEHKDGEKFDEIKSAYDNPNSVDNIDE